MSMDRYFSVDPAQRLVAEDLYHAIEGLPLICPHGHVNPGMFSRADYHFGSPLELFVIPDHYILRMLYSQGITLESLGVAPGNGQTADVSQHRQMWQTFADHFYLFRATPSGIWFREALASLFGIGETLTAKNAQALYEAIDEQLRSPDFTPRRLYERFNIAVLCTTDAATDSLGHHQAIRDSGWPGRILPTFRPDAILNIADPHWHEQIERMGTVTGVVVSNYAAYLQAIEQRRAFFKTLGATATDHSTPSPYTAELSRKEAERIFECALRGTATPHDAWLFTAHMLMEMARMSNEDGLVMQLHAGSYRNHNPDLFARFGADIGADIPLQTEYTRNLAPLLQKYGNNPRFNLIVFTLDETAYARELAPLAGHYPALKLGPPWWFHDSLNGMRRYFDQVIETAGLYNTVGFNDDTRAFPSIPARHDVWRRAACDWLAGLVVRHIVDKTDALEMAHACAYDLAKKSYRL